MRTWGVWAATLMLMGAAVEGGKDKCIEDFKNCFQSHSNGLEPDTAWRVASVEELGDRCKRIWHVWDCLDRKTYGDRPTRSHDVIMEAGIECYNSAKGPGLILGADFLMSMLRGWQYICSLHLHSFRAKPECLEEKLSSCGVNYHGPKTFDREACLRRCDLNYTKATTKAATTTTKATTTTTKAATTEAATTKVTGARAKGRCMEDYSKCLDRLLGQREFWDYGPTKTWELGSHCRLLSNLWDCLAKRTHGDKSTRTRESNMVGAHLCYLDSMGFYKGAEINGLRRRLRGSQYICSLHLQSILVKPDCLEEKLKSCGVLLGTIFDREACLRCCGCELNSGISALPPEVVAFQDSSKASGLLGSNWASRSLLFVATPLLLTSSPLSSLVSLQL